MRLGGGDGEGDMCVGSCANSLTVWRLGDWRSYNAALIIGEGTGEGEEPFCNGVEGSEVEVEMRGEAGGEGEG